MEEEIEEQILNFVKGHLIYGPERIEMELTSAFISIRRYHNVLKKRGLNTAKSRLEWGRRWNGIGEPGSQTITPGNWQAVTSKGKNYWEVEIKIPFGTIGKTPVDKERWMGNICRNVTTAGSMIEYEYGDRFSSWADMEYGFHEPERFATIIFYNITPSSSERINAERKIAREYKSLVISRIKQKIIPLEKEVNQVLTTLSNQKEILRELIDEMDIKKEVNLIFQEVNYIKRASRRVNYISLSEIDRLKGLLAKSQSLLERIDEIKYNMLLQKLFSAN